MPARRAAASSPGAGRASGSPLCISARSWRVAAATDAAEAPKGTGTGRAEVGPRRSLALPPEARRFRPWSLRCKAAGPTAVAPAAPDDDDDEGSSSSSSSSLVGSSNSKPPWASSWPPAAASLLNSHGDTQADRCNSPAVSGRHRMRTLSHGSASPSRSLTTTPGTCRVLLSSSTIGIVTASPRAQGLARASATCL